jgi:hypothetical protein
MVVLADPPLHPSGSICADCRTRSIDEPARTAYCLTSDGADFSVTKRDSFCSYYDWIGARVPYTQGLMTKGNSPNDANLDRGRPSGHASL